MSKRRQIGPPHGYDLAGWPEILAVVGGTEEAARKAAQREVDPMPTQPWYGRMVARRADLEAWRERQAARDGAVERRRAST